eukprot:TRINITY_DN6577_c0_g1_i1.p2 TRINITY_DN6577_c0_g1~~TRINITY_DN6577_c0_g1_i1.p2  ORF type:complete len:208 (-),score=37.66 TRINITY_DN6577_c0_g1_i1:109-732(-)
MHMTSIAFPLSTNAPLLSSSPLAGKRGLFFSSCSSAFQPVRKVKCLAEEDQRQEEDGGSLAKSSRTSEPTGSMCMSERSTHLNEARGSQANPQNSVRLKKLLKNRESATRCRNKRKAEITAIASDIAEVNKENAKLNCQVTKYRTFMEKLEGSSGVLKKRMGFASEENRQLQLQLSVLRSKCTQIQQTIFMLYNQNSNVEINGIKLQ